MRADRATATSAAATTAPACTFDDPFDPDDCPTVVAPYPGAPPCLHLWCGGIALEGSSRCERHQADEARP